MKIAPAFFISVSLVCGWTAPAWGFGLSPCLRVLTYDKDVFGQEPIRRINLCDEVIPKKLLLSVHEHMTAASIREYLQAPAKGPIPIPKKYQYMADGDWSKPGSRPHLSRAIMFGNWWNDEPLMQSRGQGGLFIAGGASAWRSLKPGTRLRAGGWCTVAADEHLGRLSHLGRLQHLHFMTNSNEPLEKPQQRIESTIANAMNWMQFAYQVATGAISPDQALTREMEGKLQLPSIAANHCERNQDDVKVRTLFSPRGRPDAERNKIVPDVALGSMLHIIQDSFSPSHTCRVGRSVEMGTSAVLVDVKNYNSQTDDEHAPHDVHPTWMSEYAKTGVHQYENDPVVVGAWLISAVDQQLPWEKVEMHLRKTIFADAPSNALADGEKCIGR